ncbi:probable tRNA methyltransferase 9B [Chiloscyllium plagiosum]|uniref:probable tRNA methyltransferase 9B n=1 Tax=Chiloscyllium plagiosum TaxID=36176 RepID=UPI001CB867C6|nr:probable tRNA methyltransferase 9B [Chiloscyllium plagiosum]XP_043546298.1 probable tRNA methyltransferase 9B [Chiloscyllium plagiosum]XP_043546307.1 probable tRNA methyltransferase 9B [Chiloscyllium plagiosum]XP_043546316.1 probable tRNA methyltransferase 9B [Chiloscyllium plagiosum]XP_043546325.1 probable tRNA methyltransferase 9B [Chiloscyllium plagiosum]
MELEAIQLEEAHVHNVYKQTAPYFNELRSKAWPSVRQFLLDQEPGSLIADVGCGIGKYLNVNSQAYKLGSDYCSPLVEIAKRHGHEALVCDNLILPFRDQCFNAIISVGVIHHFSTKGRRIRAIKEMTRTLHHGGQMMIYVWAMEQKHRHFEKQDIFVPWNRSLCSRPSSESGQGHNKPITANTVKAQDKDQMKTDPTEASAMLSLRQDQHTILSYRTNNHTLLENCCSRMSEDQEHPFYKNLGKSLCSWFFSKSLDEAAMQTHIDHFKSMRKSPEVIHKWRNNVQPVGNLGLPSRHCSLDGDCPPLTKRDSFEDEVFTENPNHKESQWLESSLKEKQGSHQSESCRQEILNLCQANRQIFQKNDEATRSKESTSSFKRTSATESPDSGIDSTRSVALDDKQEEFADATELMRYYHVFREGELAQLIEENVQELHILNSSYDHGNWCIIAEKE